MIVFAGPSVARLDTDKWPDLEFKPPVRQGDLYLAARTGPRAIAVIDGYFDGVPAVWHKEILWAIGQGIAVLGAASMGALRAAELDQFGMQGVGRIYAAYSSGEYTDDDEVALLHGPAELGYPVLSLAMVNARATFEAARENGVITDKQAEQAASIAKGLHYKSRTWDSVLAALRGDLPQAVLDRLQHWVRTNETDQKSLDANELLELLARGDFDQPTPDFHFEQTDLWVQATATWQARERAESGSGGGYNMFKDKSFPSG
ncbi:TfuA-like protein [uncultured Roseobacter sp.]|uniref:TfuA-like protein n=1 Tax=uncultured Roseobacter sp. TaxID=114847 RepID=UPI00261AA220|nr:TfuA-like protein [uncultured Roseobacter sp.]